MKKVLGVLFGLLLVPAAALGGLVGQCADCHVMHGGEKASLLRAVKSSGTATLAIRGTSLLSGDCTSCHAGAAAGTSIWIMPGGSKVPQVYHSDFQNDLAGGNFKYISDGGSRKGHNVVDLFPTGDDNHDDFGAPPGMYNPATHGSAFGGIGTPYARFTCAGTVGCHGTRAQVLAGYRHDNGTPDQLNDDYWVTTAQREGLDAISGAHHRSYDGPKDPDPDVFNTGVHSGEKLADSYRFIRGLKGYGNTEARWRNLDAGSHNEYYGNAAPVPLAGGSSSCNTCHLPGSPTSGSSPYKALDSSLRVPNQSMSGFCITCHGTFHSAGADNGSSGAFLRHPADYVIPNRGEYAAYTSYNLTAPVARPTLYRAASDQVSPGVDLVMCLSCHQAHASPYDGLLRFDYTAVTAGASKGQDGCLACHTTKGVLPPGR
jgi:predicted CXXCH cytochrome family protein